MPFDDENRHLSSKNGSNGMHLELSRLFAAAVVSSRFKEWLLVNPELAIATGYNGVTFDLSDEDRRLILSIQATSLSDLAQQLVNRLNGLDNNGYHESGIHIDDVNAAFDRKYIFD